jgi:hypothetical protein
MWQWPKCLAIRQAPVKSPRFPECTTNDYVSCKNIFKWNIKFLYIWHHDFRAVLSNRCTTTRFQCAANFYQIAYTYVIVRKKQFFSFIIHNFSYHVLCFIFIGLHSYGISISICRCIFMAMCSFIPTFMVCHNVSPTSECPASGKVCGTLF